MKSIVTRFRPDVPPPVNKNFAGDSGVFKTFIEITLLPNWFERVFLRKKGTSTEYVSYNEKWYEPIFIPAVSSLRAAAPCYIVCNPELQKKLTKLKQSLKMRQLRNRYHAKQKRNH